MLILGGDRRGALAAWLASGWLARRALRPFDALVARIRAIDPGQRGQRLESWAEDGELEVIVAALNDHMARLDALVARERAFASAASHELRTPLAAIRGAAEVLALMPAVPRDVLERIERSVAESAADLDALLALSQGRDLPAAETSPCTSCCRNWRRRMRSRPGKAVRESPGRARRRSAVQAAPALIGIVFTNLLRNAIRAAPDGEVPDRLGAHAFWSPTTAKA